MTTEAADAAVPEPVPDAAAEPMAADVVAHDVLAHGPAALPDPGAAEPEPKRRPRGRTALIMAAAVVLGVLGGGGAGYAAQAARKPTPLPGLSAAQPKYPAKRVAAPALPASQDDLVRTDGNLIKLLVPAPAGVHPATDLGATHVWLSLADFAETFEKPGVEFSYQAGLHFRRAAEANWYKGQESSDVYLVQYSTQFSGSASEEITDQEGYGVTSTGGKAVKVPHTLNGEVFPGRKKLGGSYPYYEGRGYAQHGDIAVEIFIDSAHPVSAKRLLTLLQSQLERL